MPRQGQNFQLSSKLRKFRIGGNQSRGGTHGQFGGEAVGQTKLVVKPEFSGHQSLFRIGRHEVYQPLDPLNGFARLFERGISGRHVENFRKVDHGNAQCYLLFIRLKKQI